jgi:hypothetical protein
MTHDRIEIAFAVPFVRVLADGAGHDSGLRMLYQTSQTSGSTPGIADITAGTNDLGGAPCSVCTATAGFDDVTGLGAPNVSNFISHF